MSEEIKTEAVSTEAVAPAVTETTTTSEATASPETKAETAQPEDKWEYNGDRKAVPDPFKKYVKGLDQWFTKHTQDTAEARKKAQMYDELIQSGRLNQNAVAPTKDNPNPGIISQQEWDAAMLSGDVNAVNSLITKALEKTVLPKAQELEKKLGQMDASQQIEAFSKLHPDFEELLDAGFDDYMIAEARSGKSLPEIYQKVKQVENNIANREKERQQKIIQEKKEGTVVGKTTAGTPDVVWVENEKESRRVSLELAMKSDPRSVRIKKK